LRDGKIAKHIQRIPLADDALWETFVRESRFYDAVSAERYPFLPQIFENRRNHNEILLVMRQYTPLAREALTHACLCRIVGALAALHRMPLPACSAAADGSTPVSADDAVLARCLEGWRSVLAEHGTDPDQTRLPEIAVRFNDISRAHHDARRCFTHGDFHIGNILLNEDAQPVFCDFQSCGVGTRAGDLAFFLSRLHADGCCRLADGAPLDTDTVLALYCDAASRAGDSVSPLEIRTQMCLSDFCTAFLFWHDYLHGSDTPRVLGIFRKMEDDFRFLADSMPTG
ncbi:MAG: aminoglycoside phosphotransferase family protein, partial [Clostridia bacterium]|nr:aminoglycoside phosphotransferase family protein [Clostridia bacterium]